MNFKTLLIFFICSSSLSFAEVKLKNFTFETLKEKGVLTIHFDGIIKDYPELNISGKTIQVTIPNSKIENTIERSYSFSSAIKDTQIRISKNSNSDTLVKAIFPFMIYEKKDRVSLTIKENKIELNFPRVIVPMKTKPNENSILGEKNIVKKELLNESYLNNLLQTSNKVSSKSLENKPNVATSQDGQTSISKKTNDIKKPISFFEFGGKFIAFLGLVLLLFYGVVTIMKKGFIRKGRLGFLSNADMISIIGQNYIGPKKSLMLIRAHNQVFLVSNTESGIHPISEIRDVAGLLKNEEISAVGQNFDTNLQTASEDHILDEKITLKEDITQSNKKSSLSSYLNVKDKVKFSEQIKSKVKNLKPLQ